MSEELARPVVAETETIHIMEDAPTPPISFNEEFLAEFERSVVFYKQWLSICYKLTREKHWVNHGSWPENPKFSLQGTGAEALAKPLGLFYAPPRMWRQEGKDTRGDFYIWWAEGEAASSRLQCKGFFIGCCDSRDKFFTVRPGWDPVVGEGDIKKSALTNWVVNAVTRLAGIRDPDPQTLIAAGLKPELISRIEYRSAASSQQRTLESGEDVISEAQAKRFYAIAKGAGLTDEQIHLFLWDEHQLKSSKDVKKRDYEKVVENVQTYAKKYSGVKA